MPAGRGSQTVHIGSRSNIEALNVTALDRPGELGQAVVLPNNKSYQIVQCDSGATASAPSGVVVAGDVAFWKDKASYIVTPDLGQAAASESTNQSSKRNMVAGVFTTAATAGNYCVVQQQGRHAGVKSDGGGDFVSGDTAIAKNTAVSDIDRVAAGTASTHTPLGIVAGAEAAGFTPVDLDLPVVP